ncbi:MAG: carbon-nitrogen hydrolase family protein [Chloroflexota bacterium]|nr:carbon-nitrogen hydrolase family protein [Chloroflexota bacterium]
MLDVALLQLRAVVLGEHEAAWAELLRRIDEAAAPPDGPAPDLIVAPEASYPGYYLHSRAAYEAAGVLADAEVEATLAERAARYGATIVVGLVQRTPRGTLRNNAVCFGPSGEVLSRTPKRFLWHFDSEWFEAAWSDPAGMVEVGGARAGVFVCADGRLPEIPRALAAAGAELLIDPTAWVSSGRDAAALSNPQVDYMLAARAIENGAWVVAADKVGVEADTVVYAGRSGVVDPTGRWRVQAPSDEPGIIRASIDLDEARGAPVPRRPDLYGGVAVPGEDSPAARATAEPIVVGDAEVRVAATALGTRPSAVDLMEQVRALATTLATQGAELLVLPDLAGADPHALSQAELLPQLEALSAETGLMLAVTLAERPTRGEGDEERVYKSMLLLDGGALLCSYRQAHLDSTEAAAGFTSGDAPPPLVDTRLGRLGLLAGGDALAPEPARALKLAGAEVLVWCASPLRDASEDGVRVIARARAAENRVYVVASASPDRAGGAYVVEPSGAVAAESLAGEAMVVAADANRAFTRRHRMAPGTDPILAHRPETYPDLFGPAP